MPDDRGESGPPSDVPANDEVPVIIPPADTGITQEEPPAAAAAPAAAPAAEDATAEDDVPVASETPTAASSSEENAQDEEGPSTTGSDGTSALEAGGDVADGVTTTASGKKKRLCRTPGCPRVIKSQGHCQRHGAKAKRCKVTECDKQAQGTHEGMCKRHWKAVNFPDQVAATPAEKVEIQPPPPEGASVYDGVLPQSISYRPSTMQSKLLEESNKVNSTDDPPQPPTEVNIMPLVTFFREGADKGPGWHRNAERRARGMHPATTLSSQLEPWERQLCLVEILLLSGGTPYANFKDLAHAWGRERGFHAVLAACVCERRGEVDRKRRSDVGIRRMGDNRPQKVRRLKSLEPRGEEAKIQDGVVAQPPPQQQQPMQVNEDVEIDQVQI